MANYLVKIGFIDDKRVTRSVGEVITDTDYTAEQISNFLELGFIEIPETEILKKEVETLTEENEQLTDTIEKIITKTIEYLVIPDGVTSIGSNFFYGWSSLKSVTLPDTFRTIESGAFGGCNNLKDVNLGKGITTIGEAAFGASSGGGNSIESIVIPKSVTSIGYGQYTGAFSGVKPNAVINCEFAEGAVAGAPWGAPGGVTINYNYTGE